MELHNALEIGVCPQGVDINEFSAEKKKKTK